MELATNQVKPKNISLFYIFIIFIIFFTTSDLIFSFTDKLAWASICSVTSGLFVFLGSALKKKNNIEKGISDKIDYINSNFNCSNIILSILDIICSIIALFTGIIFIGIIFRWFFALRMIVVINKVKTVIRGVLLGCLGYLVIRSNSIKKNIKENITLKKIINALKIAAQWIYANKKSIIGTIGSIIAGISVAIATNAELISFLPKLIWLGINWTAIIAGIVIFVLTELGVTGKGFETIKGFFERMAEVKKQKEEAKLVAEAKKELEAEKNTESKKESTQTSKEDKKAAKEAAKLAKSEAKAKAKAEAEAQKAKEEAEYKAKVEAIKAELIAKENAKVEETKA